MNNLIKLVGIHGAGKTFFLNLCRENCICQNANYIELGREITNLMAYKSVSDIESFKQCQKELLMDIIQNRQPAIITSHTVFREKDRLTYYEELENCAIPKGYVYIFSEPATILERRLRDKRKGIRDREIGDLEGITIHQDMAFNVTSRFAQDNNVAFLKINNYEDNVKYNLTEIKMFIKTLFNA